MKHSGDAHQGGRNEAEMRSLGGEVEKLDFSFHKKQSGQYATLQPHAVTRLITVLPAKPRGYVLADTACHSPTCHPSTWLSNSKMRTDDRMEHRRGRKITALLSEA